MKTDGFIGVSRPDGTKIYLNRQQVVYVTKDDLDETGKKTVIMTTEGAFTVKFTLEEVLNALSGDRKGEL